MNKLYNNGNHIFALEFNTTCGANCIMCPRERHRKKHGKFDIMPLDFSKDVIDQCVAYGVVNLAIGCFGDPLSDPHFIERVVYIKEKYPQTELSMVTTGHHLEGEIADVVAKYIDITKISHYGMTAEVFESIHRGTLKFELVKENVDKFLNRTDRGYTLITFLDLPENHHQLGEWKAYYEPLADRIDIWKPYIWGGDQVITVPPERTCWKAVELNDCFIASNGSVQCCSSDYNRELSIGNMHDNTLVEILNSEKARHVVACHQSVDALWNSDLTICKNCDKIRRGDDVLIYSNSTMKVGEFSQKMRGCK